mgnify:CR=1 FL=1
MTIALRRLATVAFEFEQDFQRLLHWSEATDAAIEQRVVEILADVRSRGRSRPPGVSILSTTSCAPSLTAASSPRCT